MLEQIGLVVDNGLFDSEEAIVTVDVGNATAEVTFDAQIGSMLQSHCAGCHSGTFPPAGFDVGNYQQVLQRATQKDANGQSTLHSKPNGTHPSGHAGGAGNPAITV